MVYVGADARKGWEGLGRRVEPGSVIAAAAAAAAAAVAAEEVAGIVWGERGLIGERANFANL